MWASSFSFKGHGPVPLVSHWSQLFNKDTPSGKGDQGVVMSELPSALLILGDGGITA